LTDLVEYVEQVVAVDGIADRINDTSAA